MRVDSRAGLAIAIVIGGAVIALTSDLAQAQAPSPLATQVTGQVVFDIESQDLQVALREFALQSKRDVLFTPDITAEKKSNALRGAYEPAAGLRLLLNGTGLTFRSADDRTLLVDVARKPNAALMRDTSVLHLARADQQEEVSQAGDQAGHIARDEYPGPLEEIVVTAQKKVERLQDVPIPVTALSAAGLVDNNQLRLQDYYAKVPGLNLIIDNRGAPTVSIRGISTGLYSNPTVGITVDDVPYGASTSSAFSWAAADFDPNELARVEVLRGPQGTLYGASSIGGLIKFVTVDPSTDGFSGRVQAGLSDVHNGSDAGYSLSGAANIPLSDAWAIRASAFTRRSPGYIDDPVLGIEGVNRADTNGGRLSALWKPSEDVSLKLDALAQKSETDGASYGFRKTGFGALEQSYIRHTGAYDRKLQAYDATLKWAGPGLDLTAVSAYGINRSEGSYDITSFFGPLTEMEFGIPGTAFVEANRTRKFTQEIRLASATAGKLEWLLGAFYTHERTRLDGSIAALVTDTGERADLWLSQLGKVYYKEYAGFADLTVHFTDRFDVQFGARESRNRQGFSQIQAGPYLTDLLGEPSPSITPDARSKDDSFTYLITPRLKLSEQLMLYARLASGYRPGGPNSNVDQPGLPREFGPDTTRNYEIGAKGQLFDRALSFDASVYLIDWKDLQIHVLDPDTALEFTTNAGSARSKGAELTLETRPWHGFSVAAWVAWNDAEIHKDFPDTSTISARAGDRLPYASRHSGALSMEKAFAVTDQMSGFLGASLSYVGSRIGEFGGNLADERQVFPSYTTTDLRAGITYDRWTANLYANNITDRRGLLGGGLGSVNPIAFLYIQPRTLGLSVARSF